MKDLIRYNTLIPYTYMVFVRMSHPCVIQIFSVNINFPLSDWRVKHDLSLHVIGENYLSMKHGKDRGMGALSQLFGAKHIAIADLY